MQFFPQGIKMLLLEQKFLIIPSTLVLPQVSQISDQEQRSDLNEHKMLRPRSSTFLA